MDSLPGGIAELTSAIQSASIQRHPDVRHDLDPGTAASGKIPVKLESHASDTIDGDSDLDEDEVPMNVLRPLPRRNTMPPLPDMRFEQSYLKSIESASGAPGVAYITIRDQIMLPLLQGFGWSLIVFGWRHMNAASKLSGASLGARIRRWWWGVNNWGLPESKTARNASFANEVKDFYEYQSSSALGD